MIKDIYKKNFLYVNLLLINATGFFGNAYAQDYFNPALLLNTEGSKIASLSSFEEGFQLPGSYKVDIYVNDQFITSKELKFNKLDRSDTVSGGLIPCINIQWLVSMGVKIYSVPNIDQFKNDQCLDLEKAIPDASINYNFNLQKLQLSIPQLYMGNNIRDYIPASEWDNGITAGYLNYNISGNVNKSSKDVFLSLNSGFNIGGFRFRNFSTYNYFADENNYKWNNIQSYVEKPLPSLRSDLIIGDNISQNALFENVGYRGLRIRSSEAMLPNSLQGYAPVIRGIAKTKSLITAKQNGYVVYQTSVNPGPFAITDLAAMSLSGDLNVTVDGGMGDIQNFIVPYSGLPILLRENRWTYDLTLGQFRSGNSNQDHPLFLQGIASHGFRKGVTAFGGIQIAENYKAAQLGLGKNMGDWGAFSFDVTHAYSTLANHQDYQGQSYRFLYSKSLNTLGTTVQLLGYRYSTKGFYTLNDVAYTSMDYLTPEAKKDIYGNIYYDDSSYFNLNYIKKGRFQLSLNQNFGSYGAIYASANYQSYWNAPKVEKAIQIGYSKSSRFFSFSLSLSLQDSLNTHADTNKSISASVTMPLNAFFARPSHNVSTIYSNSSINYSKSNGNTVQTGFNGSLGADRQFNYSVQHGVSDKTGDYGYLSLRSNSKFGTAGINYSFSNDGLDKSFSYDLAGGMLFHAGGITLGQSLGDTNVLIDAHGAKNVKVENSSNITTNSKGYAILPYSESYRLNRVALDVDSLDNQTEILTNVKNVVPTQGAIVLAKFDTRTGRRVLTTLKFQNDYVPYGSTIVEESSNVSTIVGQNGQAFLSGLADKGKLQIKWGEGANEHCSSDYNLESQLLNQPITTVSLECH